MERQMNANSKAEERALFLPASGLLRFGAVAAGWVGCAA